MSRSMLVYQELHSDVDGATLVGLHGRGGDVDQFLILSNTLPSIVTYMFPQAARSITPETRPDLGYDGYAWYRAWESDYPEPASFGQSLWEVEQFVLEVRAQKGVEKPLFLVGFDQGAVLALAIAAVVIPECISGVAAICGFIPEIRKAATPIGDVKGLPVLIVHDPQDSSATSSLVQKSITDLIKCGAIVESHDIAGARLDLSRSSALVKKWLGEQLTIRSKGPASGSRALDL